jgi:hypothetical protein
MRAKVLSLALLGALIALPVPASQFLAGPFSASARGAGSSGPLQTLIADPFLIDQLSFAAPKSFLETETGAPPQAAI